MLDVGGPRRRRAGPPRAGGLSSIEKAERAVGAMPVNSIPPWSPPQFLSPGPTLASLNGPVRCNELFLPRVGFGQCLIAGTETQLRSHLSNIKSSTHIYQTSACLFRSSEFLKAFVVFRGVLCYFYTTALSRNIFLWCRDGTGVG